MHSGEVVNTTSERPREEVKEISTAESKASNESKLKPQSIRVNESNLQIPIGNGGIAENYYWTQTLKEVTVYVDLEFQAKGKDIQCSITPGHLTLSVRGQLLLNDDFEDKVCIDESMWTISTDCNSSNVLSQVIITLDKSRKTWWKHVLVNDPEIDTTKVYLTQCSSFIFHRSTQLKKFLTMMMRLKQQLEKLCLIKSKRYLHSHN